MVEGDCFGGGVSLWSTTRRSVLTEISFFRARFQHFFALRWYFNILRQLITRSRIFRMNVAYTSVVQFSFKYLLETLVFSHASGYHIGSHDMVHIKWSIWYGTFSRLGKNWKSSRWIHHFRRFESICHLNIFRRLIYVNWTEYKALAPFPVRLSVHIMCELQRFVKLGYKKCSISDKQTKKSAHLCRYQ